MKPAEYIIYLHGFASGPGSKKAAYFKEKLEQRGHRVTVPDLNYPDFYHLTLTSQLELAEKLAREVEDQEVIMIGSSMGGLIAALASLRAGNVSALILMAPGFGIGKRWKALLCEEDMRKWQGEGERDFFHYGFGENRKLAYGFIEDLDNHSTESIEIRVPTLIFHGIADEVVPISVSRDFKRKNPNLTVLNELNDGHELIDSLDTIWHKSCVFLDSERR
ncbi:MAG: alpha/beta hydrolase [Candidatus Obscuribacterales bacterium]